MPVNTLSVGAAVTPVVIQTYISHYLNRRPLAQKPTAHISYHEGLELIRRFLHYASFHTVEEIQAFTSQWVPVPRWVHVKVVDISNEQLQRAAEHISAQLGPQGVKAVGGKNWWQWRREGAALKAEWIEMRKDYDARKQLNISKGDRIMLYVHGGAYFFGSVDEHRYQMQRHARKLKARVIAPKYRLAPQFPFPCGLHDCLAVYLHLLEEKHDPDTIILAGDSAGGGMVLSMLVVLRDQGIPLPAGAILISPWVDLTHSFPSLGGDAKMDYIPPHGFVHKPSISWPPPNADDMLDLEHVRNPQNGAKTTPRPSMSKKEEHKAEKEAKADRVRGFSVRSADKPDVDDILTLDGTGQENETWVSPNGKYSIGPKSTLSVQLDSDTRIEIKDQIQMYAANHLLTHPLVSPALQPSLGGLPPLLIQTGGGELLRDEQIYIAHKAAQPMAYLPPPSNNQTAKDIEAQAARYKPTNVQLQVWDDLCHVAPTLSFTRPAKHMYRSIAQFGAWALARAQKTSIDIDDDDSSISSDSSDSSDSEAEHSSLEDEKSQKGKKQSPRGAAKRVVKAVSVGRAGDPLPTFQHHMLRQRVDRHGRLYDLPPKGELVALNLPIADVGVPKTGPVSKWMKAQQQWNGKFSKQKIKIQKQRLKDMEKGFEGFDEDVPPPTAMAGRRVKGMKAEKPKKRSWGMSMWAGWGSKHDQTIVRDDKAAQSTEQPEATAASQLPDQPATDTTTDGTADSKLLNPKPGRPMNLSAPARPSRSRSHSRHSTVTDQGQADISLENLSTLAPIAPGLAEATRIAPERKDSPLPALPSTEPNTFSPPGIVVSDHPQSPATLIPSTDGSSTRPTKGGIAYPFSLKVDGAERQDVNASMLTLQSVNVTTPPAVDAEREEKELSILSATAAAPLTEAAKEEEKPTFLAYTADAAASTTAVKEEPETVEAEQSVDTVPTAGVSKAPETVEAERPAFDRFYTAAPGAGLFSSGVGSGDKENVTRPPVERFETAREDLNTLAAGIEKA